MKAQPELAMQASATSTGGVVNMFANDDAYRIEAVEEVDAALVMEPHGDGSHWG